MKGFLIQKMFNSTYLYQLVHATRDCFSNMYIIGITSVYPEILSN